MTKRLYLLRHAKSSWKQPELADHERPLAGRGKRAAKAMARYIVEHEIEPDLVLCSTSVRTRQTFERIELRDAKVSFEQELYGATADQLTERIRQVPDDVGTVMLIGHNPALEELARVGEKFPTGALATLELDSWSEVARAELMDFVKPRDLTD